MSRVIEATSPMIPPMMINHTLLESPRNVPVAPAGGEVQLVVHAPKAPSMSGAPASLELSEDRLHAASIVDR